MQQPKPRVANKLKHYRTLRGYTLKEVAPLLGLKNTNRLARWEKGTAFPGTRNLFKLSRIYRTFPNELLCDLFQMEADKVDTLEKKVLVQTDDQKQFNDSS
jgi:transcriptional regulator with XRE-family HTH domain